MTNLTFTNAIDGTTYDVPCDDLDTDGLARLAKEAAFAANENDATYEIDGRKATLVGPKGDVLGTFELS